MKKAVKTALVTGATGFVGAHVTRRLVAEGWDVHVILRPESGTALLGDILGQITLHRHDGSTEGMFQIFGTAGPEIVFHLASLFLAQHEPKDIVPMMGSNITFATQLAEAMTAGGVYRLINTGTSWQHYENQGYSPVCLYAATKQAFAAILKFYTATTPLQVITLKLFDTYGPEDPRAKLFNLLRNVAGAGQPLAMSPGEQLIDLVYIDDVVEAYMLAADRLQQGEVSGHEDYAVASGEPVKLKDLAELYARVTGKVVPIEWGGRPYRSREVMAPWDKGVPLPGWKPKVGLAEGIRRIVQ